MRTQKRIGWALVVLAALVFVVAIAFTCLAIWTVGPDADRWGSMAFLSVLVAFVVGVAGGMAVSDI